MELVGGIVLASLDVRIFNKMHNYFGKLQGCLFVLALSLFAGAESHGVVISAGDGSGNTQPPVDDPGFSNVGSLGSASAVYLGNRWVLTAAHVGAGPVSLGGVEYPHVPDSVVRVPNPSGRYTPQTDMILFQLQDDPRLPAIHIACSAPRLGGEVTMIGRGRDRAVEPSYWSVNVKPGEKNDVWSSLDAAVGSDRSGYTTNENRSTRWGTNIISLTGLAIDTGKGDVLSFQTTFDLGGTVAALADEAQSVTGDSGGAGFSKSGSIWELSGLIHAVEVLDSQPGGATTALYGGETFLASLYLYRDELTELADFAPDPGDFDGDGLYSADEIDWLFSEILAGRLYRDSCQFDLNGDNQISNNDVAVLLEAAGSLLGDADLDGSVDFEDFLRLGQSYGQTSGWEAGDFSGDGLVGFEDFLILATHYGRQFGVSPVEASLAVLASETGLRAQAVPEPEPLLLPWQLLSVLLLMGRRRARSSGGRSLVRV